MLPVQRARFTLAIFLLYAPSAGHAHAAKTGPHGGPQTDAGGFHVEIVTRDETLTVYLNDHALKSVATAGFKGVAILKGRDGKLMRIPLSPADGARLAGALPSALAEQVEGAVQIVTPAGDTAQGKFVPLEKQEWHDHEHEQDHERHKHE